MKIHFWFVELRHLHAGYARKTFLTKRMLCWLLLAALFCTRDYIQWIKRNGAMRISICENAKWMNSHRPNVWMNNMNKYSSTQSVKLRKRVKFMCSFENAVSYSDMNCNIQSSEYYVEIYRCMMWLGEVKYGMNPMDDVDIAAICHATRCKTTNSRMRAANNRRYWREILSQRVSCNSAYKCY